MSYDQDLELDRQIVARLDSVIVLLSSLPSEMKSADAQSQFDASLSRLSEKIDALIAMLGAEKNYTVDVNVSGADGAIHDLVSRVIEEVIVRVKQENLLTVTNV